LLAKHPLQATCRGEELEAARLAEALRLAISAELDAINLYLQFARCTRDEKARKLFEDVAREEKTHVGEFMELLRHVDPEQARELERGAKEAAEVVGLGGSKGSSSAATSNPRDWVENVVKVFHEAFDQALTLRRYIATTRVKPGLEAIGLPRYRASGSTIESVRAGYVQFHELSVEILLSQLDVDRIKATGKADAPAVAAAARRLALAEEEAIVKSLEAGAEHKLPLGDWSNPEEPVKRVSEALMRLEEKGPQPPYVLAVPPNLYTQLLAVHDRTGMTVLDMLEKIVRVVRTPALQAGTVLVFSASPFSVDIVETQLSVEYLGHEAGGLHRLRAWKYVAPRVLDPSQVAVLKA
jgi:rubrerythrin/uncharacterized linocin/CFP29 family protein